MANAITPYPANNTMGTIVNVAQDSVTARVGPFQGVTASGTSTMGWVGSAGYSVGTNGLIVTAAAATNQFSLVTISRDVYNPVAPTAVTTFVGAVSTPVVVTTQKFSATVSLVAETVYGIVTPSNNTVYNSSNSPSNLLAAGLSDIVSFNWAVVTDTGV